MSRKKLDPQEYLTLEEAKAMDNTQPAKQAWVYNRTTHEWELHHMDRFVNTEQVNWLISKGVFWYAVERKFAPVESKTVAT